VLSVVRPVGWTLSSYLLARDRPRLVAALAGFKLVAVVVLLLTLGRLGPLWSCVAVGIAFGLHALASMVAVQLSDGIGVAELAMRCGAPLVACTPMVAAAAGVRRAFADGGMRSNATLLLAQIGAGAVVYAASALVLARATSLDFVAVVTSALRRRTARSAPESSAE
jgi:PST family polysaccharide transporter